MGKTENVINGGVTREDNLVNVNLTCGAEYQAVITKLKLCSNPNCRDCLEIRKKIFKQD